MLALNSHFPLDKKGMGGLFCKVSGKTLGIVWASAIHPRPPPARLSGKASYKSCSLEAVPYIMVRIGSHIHANHSAALRTTRDWCGGEFWFAHLPNNHWNADAEFVLEIQGLMPKTIDSGTAPL
jgi:hypothetical protein